MSQQITECRWNLNNTLRTGGVHSVPETYYRAVDWWWVMVTSWHGNALRITSIFLAQKAGVSSIVSLHRLLNKSRVTGDWRLYDSHVTAQYLNITSHPGIYPFHNCHQGLYSLSGKTSYCKISWSLEVARFGFRLFQSLWNLTGPSAAALPRCLSNFGAVRLL